ncbi:MAG: sigma factor-like helix-turn-helix DNA-binding protein [Verrucomicrobiota bacterium]
MTTLAQQTKRASFEERVELVTESVDLYQKHLLHYVYKMTNQWQDAENIVQELWKFVMVYFKDDQIKHLPLLRRKAYQLFIDHYREKQRKPAIPTDQLPEHRSAKTEPEAYTDAEEQRLKAVFFEQYPGIELSDAQKEALWLHGRYGFTHMEIAEKTGTAASTIGDWIKLGRKRIAEYLSEGGK